jgi:hypothetical protein
VTARASFSPRSRIGRRPIAPLPPGRRDPAAPVARVSPG